MNVRTHKAPAELRRQRLALTVGTLVLTVPIIGFALTAAKLTKPLHARMSSADAERRTMDICNRFDGPCRVTAAPAFLDSATFPSGFRAPHTSVWQTWVASRRQTANIMINDANGRLLVFHDSGQKAAESDRAADAPVRTPFEAAQATVPLLSRFDVVRTGMRFALAGAPRHRNLSKEWLVTWNVDYGPETASHEVKFRIADIDGHLLDLFDSSQRFAVSAE